MEQYLDDSGKLGRLGYVSAIAWVTKGPFFLFLLQTSNQVLSRPLRPLPFFLLMCVCLAGSRMRAWMCVLVGEC